MRSTSMALLLVAFSLSVKAALKSEKDDEMDGKFKVIRVVPEDEDQLNVVEGLYRNSTNFELDFWKAPTGVHQFADVMVVPGFYKLLTNFLTTRHISYQVTIADVEKLVIEREKQHPIKTIEESPILRAFHRRMHDQVTSNRARYNFGDYQSYEEMIRWMDEVASQYPQIAQVFSIGVTHEGRQIRGLKIGFPIDRRDKRIVFVDGGIHAREWASVHTALYFIDQLIGNYGADGQITGYLNTLNFYIIPCLNPDGYQFTRSSPSPQVRFWRKNRGPKTCKRDFFARERCCSGVDLNRNFDFHWGEAGSSGDPCSEIFQGKAPFSEPESRAFRDFMLSPELYGKVDAYITLHTYSQMWIHPWNHEKSSFPNDVADLRSVGIQAVRALESVYGTKYKFGTGADILYPSSGGSDDWAKDTAGVKYVYLLELRPGEQEWDGFILDRNQLIPTGRETWEGVKVVVNAVLHPARAILATTPRPPSPSPNTFRMTAPRQTLEGELRSRLQQQLQGLRRRHFQRRQQLQRRSRVENEVMSPLEMSGGGCADSSPWCSTWISSNGVVCRSSSIYMRKDCARSCGFCAM